MSEQTKKTLNEYYHLWINRIDRRIGFWDFVQHLRTNSTCFDVSKQALGDEIDLILARHALGLI